MTVRDTLSAAAARSGRVCAVKDGRSGYLSAMAWSTLAVLALVIFAASASARTAPDGFADLAEKLLPAVVNISTTQTVKRSGPDSMLPRFPPGSPFEEFFKDFLERQQKRDAPPRRATSLGSGFVIDPSGLIVTNNHVIEGADEIAVNFHDDTSLKAKLIGRDAKTDLALLKVESPKPLPFVKFGNSDKSRVGDWVVAIGNPFGLGGTVTAGIISARARNINAGPYDDFLQTDASINRGNSGGPMFNLAGEVIGINTAIYSPSGGSVGIGFAIPANLAKPVVDQLKEFGRARRGWLGVRIQTVTDELAESLGLEKAHGALVANVTEGGPAEKGKIKVGDVILSFDRKPIDEMRNLPRIVAETMVGKSVDVEVWRAGKKVPLKVELGEFPEDEKIAAATPSEPQPEGKAQSVQSLGLTMSALNRELRERFKLEESVQGIVVTDVEADSPAAEKGVRAGDVIRKIGRNQEPVTSLGQIEEKVAAARKENQKSMLFLFERDGNSRFVALRLNTGKS